MEKCHCAERKKLHPRDEAEKKALISRLNRMEGQIKGIRNMLLEDRYCVDIITQVSSVSSALKAFSKELLQRHIASCVVEEIQGGKEAPEEELIFKGIGVIPKEKKKRIILEDFHTLNTKGLYTAPHRVLFIHNKWHRRSLRCLTDTTRRAFVSCSL